MLKNKEIDFKKIDIIRKEPWVTGETYIFNTPSCFSKQGDLDTQGGRRGILAPTMTFYYGFYGQARDKDTIYCTRRYDNSNSFYYLNYAVPLVCTLEDVLLLFKDNKYLINISPSKEASKAIESLLRVIDLSDKNVFIGNIFLDKSVGFEGISIFCNNERIGAIVEENFVVSVELEEGKDYDKEFRCFKSENIEIKKSNFKDIVKYSLRSCDYLGKSNLEKQVKTFRISANAEKESIKLNLPGFVKAVKKNKVVDAWAKDAPMEVKDFVYLAKNYLYPEMSAVDKHKQGYLLYLEKIKEIEGNLKHIEDCKKDIGKDYKVIQELIKDGVIESFNYNTKDGLSWIYPPREHEFIPGHKVFLGRVKIQLNPNIGFRIWPISYIGGKVLFVGTFHFRYVESGKSFCLGDFEDIIYNLIAKGQIAQLIHVVSHYINSSNEKSRHTNPDWTNMIPSNVTDDSWKVFNKEEVKKDEPIKTEIPF